MHEKLEASLLAYIIMMVITFSMLIYSLVGCTFSINIVHTQGRAEDVIDEISSATPTTDLTVPIK